MPDAPNIRLVGGIIKPVTLSFPEFRIPELEFKQAFSDKTRVLLLNTPHNPTGHVLRKEEFELIIDTCKQYPNVTCISDEVYENFVFRDDVTHERLCDFPGMEQRTVTVGSASKMFSLTGWRVGWLYGPEDLIHASRAVHSFASYCAPTHLQEGIRAALQATDSAGYSQDTHQLNATFLANANKLASILESKYGAKCSIPEGGYFLVCDVSSTSHPNDVEFCQYLAKEKGVVGVPMSIFFSGPSPNHNLVRFSICKTPQVIDRAVKALTA